MADLHDIRPKWRNGKRIKYKKEYGALSESSRRRYRALVDPRPLSERRRSPIDRLSYKAANRITNPIYQRTTRRTIEGVKKPKLYGKRSVLSRNQLQRLASRGKLPEGSLYGYNQFYFPYMDAAKSYERLKAWEAKRQEIEEDEENEELNEENYRLVTDQRYFSVEEALQAQDEPEFFYSAGGKVHKATFVERYFYFAKANDNTPLVRKKADWEK